MTQYDIFIACIVIMMTTFIGIYLFYLVEQIQESEQYQLETKEPCSIKHAFGSWGEECKTYLLNKIQILEDRIKVLENE